MSISAIFRRPRIRVVVMIREPFLAVVRNNSHMSRAGKFAGAAKEQSPSSAHHVDSVSIQIRTVHARRASNPNVVSAVDAGTTGAPLHEQIVVAALVIYVRSFDGTVVGELIRGRCGTDSQTCCRIELNKVNAAPIRAKRHPKIG